MSKVASKKTKNITPKAKTIKSKKLSVKMKAVIASAVSVVCVAAITLGLVFGLRKPDDGRNPKVDYKFSASQQLLASEINSNVKYSVFDLVDKVPYSQYATIDQLTRYGDSYFAYTDSYGNEQFFVYWKDVQGDYQTRCLTDQQGIVDGSALSYAVEKMNGDYLVVANYYTNAQYKEEITNIRYDLISIKDPANPKPIFRFDTRGMDCHVNKSDIVLKDNYFAFTYIDNINYETETVDYNTYFYAYSDELITYSPTHENNFVGDLTQSKNERVRRVFNDSGFSIISGTSHTYYYLVDGEFKSIEREIVIGNNSQVETEWNFIEISESKLLIEKVDYLADPENAVETTIKAESEEQLGAYTYSNKSYELFDIKDGVAENMNFTFKSGYASVGKIDVTDKMTNSMFALVYQKVNESNKLVDEYLIVYYDAEGSVVVEYESTNSGEQIVYASNNTFVTTKNILQPQNSVEAKKLFDFSDKDYHIDSDLNINSNYVALNSDDDTKAGVIDVWGKLILDPETSGYSRVLDLVDNRCVAFDVETEKGYTVNLKTGEAVELENYDRNPLITGSATGLNIATESQNSQIKNIYGNVVAENVKELKFPTSLNGYKVIEVWTGSDSAKASSYIVMSEVGIDETASYTSYNKDNVPLNPINVDPSVYTETWSWGSVANGMLTEQEDPSYSVNFASRGYGISSSGEAWFGAKLDGTTYKLTNFKSYIGASYQTFYNSSFTVSYTNANGATFVSTPHGYCSNFTYNYSWTFDFSCWVWIWESYADYITTGGSYLEYTSVTHYTYFKGTNLYDTDFNATTHNRVNTMTYNVKTVSTNIPDAIREDNTTPDSDWVYYGHLSYWRMSGDGTSGNMGGSWYGPNSYNDSNVANSSYSLCNTWNPGTSYWITYGSGGAFNTYLFAYYVQNTYNLNVDGSRKNTSLGTNKWSSAIYYPSKTGYDFTGWSYSGFYNCTHTVRYYRSDGTYNDYSFYYDSTSTSGSTIPYRSGYSYIKICYAGAATEGWGFTASLTSQYTPKIYTFTLSLDSTKTFTNSGTSYIYYKYDNGFFLDSSCTNKMTASANPITLPIAVGYKVETAYTFVIGSTTYNLINSTGYCLWDTTSEYTSMNTYVISYSLRGASSKWSAITYTIQYPTGCTLDDSNTDTTMTVKYGAVASVPAPVGLYYDFNGFKITGASNGHTHYYGNTTSANTSSFSTTSKDLKDYPSYVYFKNLWGTVDASKSASESHGTVTLTANWLGKRYNVQYVMNGGNAINTHQERYGEVASINGTVYKVGYNFAGWDVTGMDTVSHSFYAVENSTITDTTTVSTTTATLDAKYKNCEFSSLRGTYGSGNAVQTVTFSARWTPITYYITYSLSNGSYEAGKWAATEAHPASAVYEQSFAIDIPDREGWPVGYDFIGWTITGLGSGAKYCASQDGTYSKLVSGSTTSKSIDVTTRYYFKDLAANEGDIVNFQARWSSHEYNISYVPNGERVTFSTSSVTKLAYNASGRVYKPSRPGYTFAGWSLSALSDEVTHYYHTGSSWVNSSQVSFESTNGKYLNPTNPNVYTLLGTGTYFWVKNLHFESGATVVLTANWTPISYTITYHYTTDADYATYPTTNTLNKVSSQTHSKTQNVVFDQYFRTYSVGAADTATTVIAPTGHRIAGWYIVMNGSLGSSIITSTQAASYPEKVCLPNTDYVLNYAFTDAHLQTSGAALSNMHAYAIYEIITITLKYYVPVDASNDLSTYNFNTQVTTTFGGNLTLASYNTGSTSVSNWLVSTNLYVDGVMFNSSRTITYNSVSKYTYAGINLNWGLSNVKAHDPENPVFYLYGEVNQEYDARSLSKLTFTKVVDSTNGNYWSVAKASSSISGEVYIPNRYNDGTDDLPVRKIKSTGFISASSITSVYIPKNIESIDSSAFTSCSGLTSVTYEANSKLRIIGDSAFNNCTSLVSFTMPDSVTKLGSSVFTSCSKLESLTLSTSLTTLPSSFISHTSKLASITIPSSVTTIDTWALDYCYLTSLTIPASVISIGVQEVDYDTLTSITVDSANKYYDSRNNCNAIIRKEDGTLVLGCKNTVIPEDVKYIGEYAFHSSSWGQGETVTLPEGLIAIGSNAFYEAQFNQIILPSTLSEIGGNAFFDSSLTEIILPSSISYIGDSAFACSDLTSIYIPGDNAPYVGYNAFASCYGLTSAMFGHGVQYIYSYIFYDCGDLNYIYIPSTVEYIEEGAMDGSLNLRIYVGKSEGYTTGWDSTWWAGDVEYYDNADLAIYYFLSAAYPDWSFNLTTEDWITVTDYHGSDYLNLKIPAMVDEVYFDYSNTSSALDSARTLYVGTNVQCFTYLGGDDNTKLREITLSPGLVYIGEYGFSNLANLISVNIPYTVDAIGSSLFRGCNSLTSITVDENNPYYTAITNTIIHIESKAVIAGAGCSTIPTTVAETIFDYSFHTVSMTEIRIPGNIKSISNFAFYTITTPTVVLEEGVESVQTNAFEALYYSPGVSVSLPASLKKVNEKAFTGSVTSISVASGNTIYDSRDNCNAVIEKSTNKLVFACTATTIPSTVTSIGSHAFFALKMPASFTIPTSVTFVEKYAFFKTTFAGNISTANITKISQEAFANAIFNGVLTLGSKLVEIDNKAFYCAQLNNQTSLEFPSSVKVIGTEAFRYVGMSIVFNSGLYNIGVRAFASNTVATSIVIPDSVKEIKSGAFAYMTALQTIDFGNGITYIPDRVCNGNTALTEIIIPENVKTIGVEAFYNCKNVTGTVVIPEKVTSIGNYAFYYLGYNEDVDVVFGKNITTIGNYAFAYSYIKKVELGDKVTTIGDYAFYYSKKMTYANLGNGAVSIGVCAFHTCSALVDVVFSSNLTAIKDSAFAYCSALKAVNLPWSSSYYIGNYSFEQCTTITSVEIPSFSVSVGYRAFRNCTALKYVWLDSGISTITASSYTYSVFYGCSSLVCVYTNASSKPSGWSTYLNYKTSSTPSEMYYGQTIATYYGAVYTGFTFSGSYGSLTLSKYTGSASVVYVPSIVKTIGSMAFDSNTTITKVVIPHGVTSLLTDAFEDCSNLVEAVLPQSLTSIGSWAFNRCYKLSIVSIPSSVTTINSYAFGSTAITSLYIPKSVTSIDISSFYNCSKLVSIIVDEENTVYDSRNNCNAIIHSGDDRLVRASNNTVIPSTVKVIGDYAFTGATHTSISLPENVTTVNYYAFYGMPNLTSVTMTNVTTIGSYAFYNSSNLSTIILNEGVDSIGSYAFANISALTSIVLPNTVTYLGDSAFAASGLTSVNIPTGISMIFDYTFQNTKLTSIHIPANVESVGYGAFYYVSTLQTVTMENGVTYIDGYAFQGCTNLVTVNMSAYVTQIGDGVFYNCSKLKNFVMPAGVTSIGSNAFYNCDALTSIWVPSSASVSASSYSSAPFYGCATTVRVYTDASSKKSAWGTYWHYYASGLVLTTTYGTTYDAYFRTMYPNFSVTTYGSTVSLSSYTGSETTVNVPHGITNISGYAFNGKSAITTINLPSSVNTLMDGSFASLSGLQTLNFAEGLREYNVGAVMYTNVLSTINLPSTVTSIVPHYNVSHYDSLTAINFNSGNKNYHVVDGYLIEKTSNKLVMPINRSLTSYTIPNYVTEIGDYAFYQICSVTSYTIPANIVKIGKQAFAGTTFTGITFASGSKLKVIEEKAFYSNHITSITLPEGLEIIGNSVFELSYATAITISIPSTVKNIGYKVATNNVGSITVSSSNAYYSSSDGMLIEKATNRLITGKSGATTVPSTVKVIAPYAFYSMLSGTSFTIPANVVSIGNNAFESNTKLTTLTFSEGLKEISYRAFYGCSKIASITLPNSLEHIDHGAFASCSALKTVYIGSNVKFIAGATATEGAFYSTHSSIVFYCSDLEKPKGWEAYWCYRSSSTKGTVVWGYGSAAVASATAYSVSSVDTRNAGHYGNVSYSVETAVDSVSNNYVLLVLEENDIA